MSRYMPEIVELGMRTEAKAVYAFVLDGNKGTGGCPLVMGMEALDRRTYNERCRELIAMMRRSADLLAADLLRQGFGGEG
jgi:hypothetical protein